MEVSDAQKHDNIVYNPDLHFCNCEVVFDVKK